ncbi:flagellar assembly protein FliW [Thalassobacillus pellis]|uniref:flagellar assembly protein FliW n=1 Tax=Thalassobacillus pellis TaxID=748008 RepID=UPI00195F6094|nr:flagellar assembly protein FliW [Thalassobacillus pellis]MBM7551431.1 flagellar assembly factor FliW [Thalassobacillus pellis]
MKIQTKYFGEITIEQSQVIEFPAGLPGFENEKHFVLLSLDGEGNYQVLQSIINEQISLIVTNPYLFFHSYEFNIDDASLDLLEISSSKDVLVLAVLTLRNPFAKTTANLQAPLIINHRVNKGKQLILNDNGYHTKHLLEASLKEADADARAESKSK